MQIEKAKYETTKQNGVQSCTPSEAVVNAQEMSLESLAKLDRICCTRDGRLLVPSNASSVLTVDISMAV